MSASLVGSEMCIRDRSCCVAAVAGPLCREPWPAACCVSRGIFRAMGGSGDSWRLCSHSPLAAAPGL
eukprot:14984437-Alexandrium_andersonii.AAC.1